jgi:hypothetical protein
VAVVTSPRCDRLGVRQRRWSYPSCWVLSPLPVICQLTGTVPPRGDDWIGGVEPVAFWTSGTAAADGMDGSLFLQAPLAPVCVPWSLPLFAGVWFDKRKKKNPKRFCPIWRPIFFFFDLSICRDAA